MATTLELFWNLSSSTKKDRLDASVKLVSTLDHFQSQFIPPPSSEEDDVEDNLETFNAQDVSYSIRRLVRGLASPRESSRIGFSVALTELLSRLNSVTCSQIVSLILESSKSQGNMTGQEERDLMFARLFGLSSVIQSGLLVREEPLPSSSTVTSSLSSYEKVIISLVELGEKKSWLRECAWWTLSLAVDGLAGSSVAWKNEAIKSTVEALYKDPASWTPEKIALTLKLQALYPKQKWSTLLSPTFKNPDILSNGNLAALGKILKESHTLEDEETGTTLQNGGSWKPQVHFVWDALLDILLPGPNSIGSSKGSIQEFWRVVVDESLFSSTSSTERKYWGFQIFQKTLPRINQNSDLPMLFTKNFMRSWINHLSNGDRYLHKAARAVSVDLQQVVKNNPTIGFTLVLQLTGVHGSRQFDKLTKTKTVESILLSMNAEGITNYIDYLLSQMNDNKDSADTQALSAKRLWIVSQLSSLIRQSLIPKTDEWIQTILDFFTIHGLFLVVKKSEKSPYVGLHSTPKPAISEEVRKECRIRLLSSLADLTTQTTIVKSVDGKTTKLAGVASTGDFWVSRVLSTIRKLEELPKYTTLLSPVDDEDESGAQLLAKAWDVLEKLQDMKSDQQEAVRGAELLLSATVLHRYCTNGEEEEGMEEEEESSGSADLVACIAGTSKLFSTADKKPKKPKKNINKDEENDDGTEQPEVIDVLVDILIGFLEKATSYMRTVANHSFGLLSGCAKESTIDLILTQLERRDPAHDDAEDEDEEMEDAEEKGDASDGKASESSSEAAADDAEDDNEAPDMELREKIEDALRASGIEAATGETGDLDEDEEEDLMDDEQMLAIDEQLAEVFRSRANEKKGGKDANAQREATHFKNRVLDLIEIFIKKQPTSPYIIRLILPVVELVVNNGPDEKQLSDKATGVLRSRIGKLKELPLRLKVEETIPVLQELHAKARRARSSEDIATLTQCSLYVVRALLHVESSDAVVEVYRESLKDYLTRKASHLNNAFFQEFIARNPETAWSLRNDFFTFANSENAVNIYRQCQAFQLINFLLMRLPLKDDLRMKEFIKYMPKLQEVLSSLIIDACSAETTSFTAPQLKEVLKLGLTAIRQKKRVIMDSNKLAKVWSSNTWQTVHDHLVKSERFGKSTGLHAMCQQIQEATSPISNSKKEGKKFKGEGEKVAAKRKVEEIEDDGGAEEADLAKKVKRKKAKSKV